MKCSCRDFWFLKLLSLLSAHVNDNNKSLQLISVPVILKCCNVVRGNQLYSDTHPLLLAWSLCNIMRMFLAYSMSAGTSEVSDRYERFSSVSSSVEFDQTDNVSISNETKIKKHTLNSS